MWRRAGSPRHPPGWPDRLRPHDRVSTIPATPRARSASVTARSNAWPRGPAHPVWGNDPDPASAGPMAHVGAPDKPVPRHRQRPRRVRVGGWARPGALLSRRPGTQTPPRSRPPDLSRKGRVPRRGPRPRRPAQRVRAHPRCVRRPAGEPRGPLPDPSGMRDPVNQKDAPAMRRPGLNRTAARRRAGRSLALRPSGAPRRGCSGLRPAAA